MSFMRFFSDTSTNNQDSLTIDEINIKLANTTSLEELTQLMTTIIQSDDGASKLYSAVKNLETTLRLNSIKQEQLLHLVFSGHKQFCEIMKSLDNMHASYDIWSNYFSDEYKHKHPLEYQSLEADVFKMFGEKTIKEYKQNSAFLDQFNVMLKQDKNHYQQVVKTYNSLISDYENDNNLLGQIAKAFW